jgi:hypothetical protein
MLASMSNAGNPNVPRVIPVGSDGKKVLGESTNPIVVNINQSSITGDMAVGGKLDVVGDIAAAGGFRQSIGPFYVTTAADQAAVGTKFGDTINQTWVAPRAGSVTAVSGMIDAAVTGAGKSITARVYKNGALLNAALDLAFTQAGGETTKRAAAAKDAYAFAAGDQLKIVYTTDTITNAPKLVVSLEIEC